MRMIYPVEQKHTVSRRVSPVIDSARWCGTEREHAASLRAFLFIAGNLFFLALFALFRAGEDGVIAGGLFMLWLCWLERAEFRP